MKKSFVLCLSFVIMTAILSGCGASPSGNDAAAASSDQQSTEPDNQQSAENAETTIPNETEDSNDMDTNATSKNLVVYFSVPETTDPDHMSREEELSTVVIDGEVLGNTQYVANVIGQNTGADVFRIEPVTPYPLDHSALEDIAQKEQQENARPEIAGVVENIEQYETVFFGFPNWFYGMPQIMYSFLDQYDLSGKTIVPFVTSGGSGFSNAISEIVEMEPDAYVITDGLSISRTVVQDAGQDIIEWLTEKGFIQ